MSVVQHMPLAIGLAVIALAFISDQLGVGREPPNLTKPDDR